MKISELFRHVNVPRSVSCCYDGADDKDLFDWQRDCLISTGVICRASSIIVSAPTSAGKTLICELTVLSRCLLTNLKAVVILPYVSVAHEKLLRWQSSFIRAGVRVEGFFGSSGPCSPDSWDVAVCTIEKANSLLNRLIVDNAVSKLGCVVIDELHFIGDTDRGYILELLLTKIRVVSSKGHKIQILGMSATLPNLSTLARWLDAELFTTDFRPTCLEELLKIDRQLFNKHSECVATLDNNLLQPNDPDDIIGLCLETCLQGRGVLIFCESRARCENLADNIAKQFSAILSPQHQHALQDSLSSVIQPNKLDAFMAYFNRIIHGADRRLRAVLKFAVAFHHAGLTFEEREQVELGFRKQIILVLTATSTLSSGVNLPVDRVIIRSIGAASSQGGKVSTGPPALTATSYKQMSGRAGRTGSDKGECILICKKAELGRAVAIITGELNPIRSALILDRVIASGDNSASASNHVLLSPALKRALLEAFATGLASSFDDAEAYIRSTLFFAQLNDGTAAGLSDDAERIAPVLSSVKSCLEFLKQNEFLRQTGNTWTPSQLGLATLDSALSVDEALLVLHDLSKARKAVALDTELHLVFLVTPMHYGQRSNDVDWQSFYELYRRLPSAERNVAHLIGLQESRLLKESQFTGSRKSKDLVLYERYYFAMALLDLISEMPLASVASKYSCSKGVLQSLQQQAATYAGMVQVFCDRLGWWPMKVLLMDMAERLAFGVKRDLTELVRIDGLDGMRARVFHREGFGTISSIASAKLEEITAILRKAVPFESVSIDNAVENGKKHTWLAGHAELNEFVAAELIQLRARKLVTESLHHFGVAVAPAGSSGMLSHVAVSSSLKPSDTVDSTLTVPADLATLSTQKPPFGIFATTTNVQDSPVKIDPIDELKEIVSGVEEFAIATPIKSRPESSKETGDVSRDSLADFDLSGVLTEAQVETEQVASSGSPSVKTAPSTSTPIAAAVLTNVTSLLKPSDDSAKSPVLFADNSTLESSNCSKACDSASADENVACLSRRATLRLNDAADEPCINLKRSYRKDYQSSTPSPALRKRSRQRCSQTTSTNNNINSSDCSKPSFSKFVAYGEACTRICDLPAIEPCISASCSSNDCDSVVAQLLQNSGLISVAPAFTANDDTGISSKPNQSARRALVGLAFCVNSVQVHYVPFVSNGRPAIEQLNSVARLFCNENVSYSLATFDAKLLFEFLWSSLEFRQFYFTTNSTVPLGCCCSAAWLLNKQVSQLNIVSLLYEFAPEALDVVKGITFSGLSRTENEARSEATAVASLIGRLEQKLAQSSLLGVYERIELPCIPCVVIMQSNGIGFAAEQCEKLRNQLQLRLRELETSACKLARRRFSMTSSKEIAKILYDELGLPAVSLVPSKGPGSKSNACGNPRRQQYSTSKEVLQKLQKLHEFPSVILEWRKVHTVLTRGIAPLLSKHRRCESGDRIFGRLCCFSSTGRIIMFNPNLQTIPKTEFSGIDLLAADESDFAVDVASSENYQDESVLFGDDESSTSLRTVFTACQDCVFLSADYSQMELRILAHLSNDAQLISILHSPSGDVFKLIASVWRNVSEADVTTDMRQQAKRMCYGIVYGMGLKSLSQQLDVNEDVASLFLDRFKAAFPGIWNWRMEMLRKCKARKYTETIAGRRRHLPDFSDTRNAQSIAHAERQAINTCIQGSAADIFKTALISLQAALKEKYKWPASLVVAKLVLQLHDELILEVRVQHLPEVASLARHCMENAIQLSVTLPVQLKTGSNWRDLFEYLETS